MPRTRSSSRPPRFAADDPRRGHPLAQLDLNLLVIFDVLMRERSVSRTAVVMHRTASAISHALGRLRARLHDPLLVRDGGRMEPTQRALRLWSELQPLLGGLGQALANDERFDPATSRRRLRIALPALTAGLFSRLWQRVHAQAPELVLVCTQYRDETLDDLRDGGTDLAILPTHALLPEGVACEPLAELPWACAVREGHPALADWSLETWQRLPLVGTDIGRVVLPLTEALRQRGIQLNVPLIVPNLLAMADVLEHTDLVGTNLRLVLAPMARGRRIRLLEPPLPIPPMGLGLYRSRRWIGDPGLDWMAAQLAAAVREEVAAAG